MNDAVMFRVMRILSWLGARGRLKLEVRGTHHVPTHGPAILVARHYHHLFDGVALHMAIPRRVHFIVTLDWVRHPLTLRAMKGLARAARWPVVLRGDAVARRDPETPERSDGDFTDIESGRYRRQALRDSIALLREGKLLAIFPEGYPNIDPHYTPKVRPDEMLPFKAGFAALAAAAEKRLGLEIPLIPVGIHYTAGPRWVAWLRFGNPLHAHRFTSRDALIRAIEREVAHLSEAPPPDGEGRQGPI